MKMVKESFESIRERLLRYECVEGSLAILIYKQKFSFVRLIKKSSLKMGTFGNLGKFGGGVSRGEDFPYKQ